MIKEIFHVYVEGDREVGIPDTEATVTIEENLREKKDSWIKEWKEQLSSIYDTDIAHVLTEEEETKVQEEADKYFKEMAHLEEI
jgi:hypothetical protein